jgi:adenylate cyclase
MEGNAICTLTIRGADGRESKISLVDGRSYRVGRAEPADLCLDDPSVSRMHALFSVSNTGVVVSDLSSTNGTFVNGRRVEIPVDLKAGDLVDIGSFKLSIQLHAESAVEAAGRSAGRTMTAQLRPSTAVVLVCRLAGYVGGGGDLSDQRFATLRDCWADHVTHAVTSHEGAVDKVLHDTVVAVWYGMDAEKLARLALRSAAQAKVATDQLNGSSLWPAGAGNSPLRCIVAVNSGMALVGTVGSATGMKSFAVLGDTINVALQMAEAGSEELLACLISAAVAQVLGAAQETRKISSVTNATSGESVDVLAIERSGEIHFG